MAAEQEEEPKQEEPSPEEEHHQSHRLHQERTSGMEHSVLKFKDVNFFVGKGDKQKGLLTDISAVVKSGRVLAMMGPSGAGKSVLLSALTLDASFGTSTGACKLNGKPLTHHIFQEHCFIVKQKDTHWPYLTCRETLKYAAELYEVTQKDEEDSLVEEIIGKLGLQVCADTPAARLSGGQRRRLSVGIALVKQPRVMFLDEPTTGLDAASTMKLVEEINRISKEEGLITICTIHQPSSKVYSVFDQIMILSRGRTAFVGDAKEASPYFSEIGYPIPDETNPAEYFMDLVNSDFSDEAAVDKILDLWEEKGPGLTTSHHSNNDDDEDGVVNEFKKSVFNEMRVLFRRQFTLIVRDPVMYVGRAVVMLVANVIFSLVYLSTRDDTQDQAINRFWLTTWLVVIPAQFGTVAAFGLNDEFKSVLNETKNGMMAGISYVVAKTILVLPVMLIFAVFALGIPFYLIADAPAESFGHCVFLFAACIFIFESVAECVSVWFDDVIIGMLQFMNYWFAGFLFGGFLIPLRDLYYPFELFYYVWPYAYYLRSFNYQFFKYSTFEACDRALNPEAAVCVDSTEGIDVLGGLSIVFPVLSTKDYFALDMAILIAIGVFYKLMYVVGVVYNTNKSSAFKTS